MSIQTTLPWSTNFFSDAIACLIMSHFWRESFWVIRFKKFGQEKLKWKYMTQPSAAPHFIITVLPFCWNGPLSFNSSVKVETTKLKIGINGTWARQSICELNDAPQLNVATESPETLGVLPHGFVAFCKCPPPCASSEEESRKGKRPGGGGKRLMALCRRTFSLQLFQKEIRKGKERLHASLGTSS